VEAGWESCALRYTRYLDRLMNGWWYWMLLWAGKSEDSRFIGYATLHPSRVIPHRSWIDPPSESGLGVNSLNSSLILLMGSC
jgi:hypothetical protein